MFIGQLPAWFTENNLRDLCRPCGPVLHVAILRQNNGRSRCCGFVTFRDEAGVANALNILHDVVELPDMEGRPVQMGRARHRARGPESLNGCKLHVGQIPPSVNEEELKRLFRKHGRTKMVKIVGPRPVAKSFAVVQFALAVDAAAAIKATNGLKLVPTARLPLLVQYADSRMQKFHTQQQAAPPCTEPEPEPAAPLFSPLPPLSPGLHAAPPFLHPGHPHSPAPGQLQHIPGQHHLMDAAATAALAQPLPLGYEYELPMAMAAMGMAMPYQQYYPQQAYDTTPCKWPLATDPCGTLPYARRTLFDSPPPPLMLPEMQQTFWHIEGHEHGHGHGADDGFGFAPIPVYTDDLELGQSSGQTNVYASHQAQDQAPTPHHAQAQAHMDKLAAKLRPPKPLPASTPPGVGAHMDKLAAKLRPPKPLRATTPPGVGAHMDRLAAKLRPPKPLPASAPPRVGAL